MEILFDCFPGGRTKALTLSYDDGRVHDRRMIDIMNRYGVKGTFHLNSARLGAPDYVTKEEVKELYAGHEIAAHTVTHPHLPYIPKEMRVRELMDDREELERIVGYPVKGMSYPYGTVSTEVSDLLTLLGFSYSRTTVASYKYDLPGQFQEWSPTCHHREDLLIRIQTFLELPHKKKPQLFYVWGHSYEFENNQNWQLLEQFCELVGANENIWYATNKQIIDYMVAINRLEVSVNGQMIYNPSAIEVWCTVNGSARRISPGVLTYVTQEVQYLTS